MAQSWQKVADRLTYAEAQLALPENHPSMTPGRRENLQAIADHARTALAKASRCRMCGRGISSSESLWLGVGPECSQKLERVAA